MKAATQIKKMARQARSACAFMSGVSSALKNKVLKEMSEALIEKQRFIIKENQRDLRAARAKGLARALLDRLTLNKARLEEMSGSLAKLAELADPVGEVIKAWRVESGLWIHKVRVPLGVVAIIYESRPNVTSDCIGLCFKSGNCVILKGGSEALHSNLAIHRVLSDVLKHNGFPEGVAVMVGTAQRQVVNTLLGLSEDIDVVIPRGGEGLIDMVSRLSRIPVIKHYKGICHVYIDEWADLNMAEEICFNAKVQRPGVCNAMECMLVHRDCAVRFLPAMIRRFRAAHVEIRADALTRRIVKGRSIRAAQEVDYRREYLDLKLSVKVVADIDEAIAHINEYGSHHSDSVVTENYDNAVRFLTRVDSACVYVNASTRFTDGNQFGMGAEIGISTDKLHARGPMGLEELTTYKYMVFGSGQIRS